MLIDDGVPVHNFADWCMGPFIVKGKVLRAYYIPAAFAAGGK